METTFLLIIIALLAVVIMLIFVFRSKSNDETPQLQNKVEELQSSLAKLETNLVGESPKEHTNRLRAIG